MADIHKVKVGDILRIDVVVDEVDLQGGVIAWKLTKDWLETAEHIRARRFGTLESRIL